MPRFIALLRAINVGGHTVTMERLRSIFASLEFQDVTTFIASGNVIFQAASKSAKALEVRIAARLRDELGYDVDTFLRSDRELTAIAGYAPFPKSAVAAALAFNVAFLGDPLDAVATRKVMALETDIDSFRVHGREVYWLCRTRQSDSRFSNAVLERTLGRRSTIRGASTIAKLAAKYPPE